MKPYGKPLQIRWWRRLKGDNILTSAAFIFYYCAFCEGFTELISALFRRTYIMLNELFLCAC